MSIPFKMTVVTVATAVSLYSAFAVIGVIAVTRFELHQAALPGEFGLVLDARRRKYLPGETAEHFRD